MQELSGLLAQYGLLLVFANVLLAQLGVPLPAVPMLIVAGAFAAQGEFPFAVLIGVAVIASLIGDIPWYIAGRRYGYRVLRTLCRIAIEPDSCVKQTENIFERWGPRSLIVAKYIPGFATVAPPLAGAMHLTFWRFMGFSALAALLWAIVPAGAGMLFSTEIEQLLAWLERMGSGALLIIGAVIAVYVGVKIVERHLLIRFLRMVRISVDELHSFMQQGVQIVILDVRSAAARKLDPRRIPGAIPVDMAAPEAHLGKVPPDSHVIVYCS